MAKPLEAIDVHAHIGRYRRVPSSELLDALYSGDVDVILARARKAHTGLTIVSPMEGLLPRGDGDPVSANTRAAEVVARTDGLMYWVIVDPLKPETFEQADDMLRRPKCAGIKIHPEEHVYPIAAHAHAIFRFAADRRAVVQSHSGEKNSMPEDFVPFADRYPEVTLILSHLGCGWDDDPSHQVRAVQASRAGNVYTDTSSAKSITSGLLEWAVGQIGASRILYGTDSPSYFAPMQRARVDYADISPTDKRLILKDNAVRILNIRSGRKETISHGQA